MERYGTECVNSQRNCVILWMIDRVERQRSGYRIYEQAVATFNRCISRYLEQVRDRFQGGLDASNVFN